MASTLTPLADYSRQIAQVGTPPLYVYDAKGNKLSSELLQLSALLRIANNLEGNDGTLTARVGILLDQADDFRDLVDDLAGRPDPLAIVGWHLVGDSSVVEVSLSYTDGQALFTLGRRWDEVVKEGQLS